MLVRGPALDGITQIWAYSHMQLFVVFLDLSSCSFYLRYREDNTHRESHLTIQCAGCTTLTRQFHMQMRPTVRFHLRLQVPPRLDSVIQHLRGASSAASSSQGLGRMRHCSLPDLPFTVPGPHDQPCNPFVPADAFDKNFAFSVRNKIQKRIPKCLLRCCRSDPAVLIISAFRCISRISLLSPRT